MSKQLAGYRSLESVTPREILYDLKNYSLKPGGIVLDGTNGRDGGNTNTYDIRAGWAMGQITASGLWVPCKRTRVNGTSGSVTSAVVDNSYAFAAGDAIDINGDAVTLTAVTYSTHTLTWSGAVTVADNEAVTATDGSATCRGFLFDFARLRNTENDAAANVPSQLLIEGKVSQSQLLGDIDAIIAVASSMFLDGIQIWNNNVRVL